MIILFACSVTIRKYNFIQGAQSRWRHAQSMAVENFTGPFPEPWNQGIIAHRMELVNNKSMSSFIQISSKVRKLLTIFKGI